MLRKKMAFFTATPLAIAMLISPVVLMAGSDDGGLSPIEQLGKKIFFDKKLSIRQNQACATCHVPDVGWVGDNPTFNEHGAVYEGSITGEFGNRKPPSSAYATLSPIFYADFGNRLLGNNTAICSGRSGVQASARSAGRETSIASVVRRTGL
jgi:cytochrome c peroxidase